MYAILLMKSLATGSSSLTVFVSYIPSLYFLLSTFIPHLLRFFLSKLSSGPFEVNFGSRYLCVPETCTC